MSQKTTVPKSNPKQTRKYLKTLTKASGHKLRSTSRVIKYGTISFGRNVWLSLASTLVMTITLLILFVTVLASAVLSETATSMRDKIDITIFLKPETSENILSSLSDILKTDSNIKPDSLVLNTSEDELKNFLEENSDNEELVETINDEEMHKIMLKTMQSTIRFKVYDAENLGSIKSIISTDQLFAEYLDEEKTPTYDMNQAEIATINSWATLAKNGGIILGIVFLAISILVIFNTVRMAIFSRREEIYMMKLVGADRSFIRGPFLVEAQLSGLISGTIASILGYFGFKLFSPTLIDYGINISSISDIFNSSLLVLFFAIMILLGIIIGSFSARLATQKYLRKL